MGNIKEKGFTLIEVMITITILGVGILAVATMQISSTGTNASAQKITEATTLATDRMETLMGLPWNDPLLASVSSPFNDGLAPTGFTIQWTVEDDTPLTDTKKIVITVTRTDIIYNRSVTLESYRAKML